MLFERLSNKINLQKLVETEKSDGNLSKTFSDFKQKFVFVQSVDFSEVKLLPKYQDLVVTHKMIMRSDPEIEIGMRAVYFQKIFEIQYIVPIDLKYSTMYLKEVK
jgi:hypothetical protein